MFRYCPVLAAPVLLAAAASTASAGHHEAPSTGHHEAPTPAERIQALEAAHGGDTYAAQNAVQADMTLDLGRMQFDATMTFTPSLGHVRMDIDGVGTLVFDGTTAWVSPSDAEVPGPPARFHLLTWTYFLAASFKLDDPGTNPSDAGKLAATSSADQRVGTKVSFDAGVGDASDDWYIAFTDDQGRMDAMAYGKTRNNDKPAANASMIVYADFVEVDGVAFASSWSFHAWNPTEGIVKERGTAKLSNFKFVTPAPDAFVKPADAVESKKRRKKGQKRKS